MKRPRYFCEHCGAEVGRDASVCPKCGRFFSSVKCPRCGFSGEPFLFRNGCPTCGYSAASGSPAVPKSGRPTASGPLPGWIYAAAFMALAAALAAVLIAAR